jgi:hypothetical protein
MAAQIEILWLKTQQLEVPIAVIAPSAGKPARALLDENACFARNRDVRHPRLSKYLALPTSCSLATARRLNRWNHNPHFND